jgi:hypothetical protein
MRRCDIIELDHTLCIQQIEQSSWYWDEDIMPHLHLPCVSYNKFQCNLWRHALNWATQLMFEDFSDHAILQLVHDLQQPGVCAVSDGSAKDGCGAAAWIIALTGVHEEPGDTTELSG